MTMIYASGELGDCTYGLYFISFLIIGVVGCFIGYVLSEHQFTGLCVACGWSAIIEVYGLYNLIFVAFYQSLVFYSILTVLNVVRSMYGAYAHKE